MQCWVDKFNGNNIDPQLKEINRRGLLMLKNLQERFNIKDEEVIRI